MMVRVMMVRVKMMIMMTKDAEGCIYLFHSTSLYTGSQVDDHDVVVVVVVVVVVYVVVVDDNYVDVVVVYVIVVDYHYVDVVVVDDYNMGCGGMYLCHSTSRRTWIPKRHIL